MKKSLILAVILASILGVAGHYWSVEKAAREKMARELNEEKNRLADALDNLNKTSDLTAMHKEKNLELAAEVTELKNDLAARSTRQEQQAAAIASLEKLLMAAREETERHKTETARLKDQAARDRQAKIETDDQLAQVKNDLDKLRTSYDRLINTLPKGSRPPETPSEETSPNADQIAEAAALKVEAARTLGELNQLRMQLARDYGALAEVKKELALLSGLKDSGEDAPHTIREVYAHLGRELAGLIESQEASLSVKAKELMLTLPETVMFPPGRAELTPEGQKYLDIVAKTLQNLPGLNIVVIGHTDNQLSQNRQDRHLPSAWELSAARAGAVAKYLEAGGQLNFSRLEAVGRAFHEPLAPNDTQEGRRRNNRVDLIISEP